MLVPPRAPHAPCPEECLTHLPQRTRQTHSQACIGHESLYYSKEEEGSGTGMQAAIFPEFLGHDTGSKQGDPQPPRRSKTRKEYGEGLRGSQDTRDPPTNLSKNWTLRQNSGRSSWQRVQHRSWSNKINCTDWFHSAGLHIPKPSQENQDPNWLPLLQKSWIL